MSVLNSIQMQEMKTKLQNMGASAIGNSEMYMSPEAKMAKMGANGPSIFDVAKSNGATSMEKKDPNPEEGGLIKRGFNMMEVGMQNVSSAGSLKGEVNSLKNQSIFNSQQATQMKAQLQQQTATTVGKMKSHQEIIKSTSQEIADDQAQYADLMNQIEAERSFDGTGSGASSAYSLQSVVAPITAQAGSLISPNQKNEESKASKPTVKDDSKLQGLQANADSLGMKISSNQTRINASVNVMNGERAKINQIMSNVQAFGTKSTAQAQQATQKAAGLQKAGMITSTVGGGVGAIGATVTLFAAPVGAAISAGGAVIGAAGSGMSVAASSAQGDLEGAASNLKGMSDSVASAKSNISEFKELKKA